MAWGKKRKRKKSKNKAPATVLFTSEKNENGRKQKCVYAQCHYSGVGHGPIWGHGDNSVKKVLAELTQNCDCPARFHHKREQQGMRLL